MCKEKPGRVRIYTELVEVKSVGVFPDFKN